MCPAVGSDRVQRQRPASVTVLDEASASMSPIIEIGDRLTVLRHEGESLRRGAVITCFDGRRVVAHRLIGWRAGILTTKGDANRDADPPVDDARYCGEVIAARRPDGRTRDLTSRRWRVTGAALAGIDALPVGRTLRWILTRLLCHASARCLR